MGTSNFNYNGVSKLYPVLMELDEHSDTEMEVEAIAGALEHYLEEFSADVEYKYSGSRSGHYVLGEITRQRDFGDVCLEVRAQILLNLGYYEGACLDLSIEFYDGSYDWIDDVDYIEDWKDCNLSEMNAGLCKIQEANSRKYATAQTEALSEVIEQAFSKITTPYQMIGRASNGETFYQKAV